MPAPLARSDPVPSSVPPSRSNDLAFHALYDSTYTNMVSYLANSQLHLLPPNPYPPPVSQVPVAHKVWIIDCKSCATFITNRGMKAVLLLRPNVSLYSSDALPTNCSAHSSIPQTSGLPNSCQSALPLRTCECLTQTLCCHGCGSAIGYMIVIPCIRCTSSVTSSNRATNGHRFVFHSTQVVGSERYYVTDEAGVVPYEVITPQTSQLISTQGVRVDRLGGSTENNEASPTSDSDDFRDSDIPHDVHTSYPLGSTVPYSPIQKLKAGDVLYWHHLLRHGEIPGVVDNPEARMKWDPKQTVDR